KGFSIKRFVPQKLGGDVVQLIAMLQEDFFGIGVGIVQEPFYFRIDLLRRLFTAIALERAVGGRQVDRALPLNAASQPDGFAHAKKTNHLPGESRDTLQIILSAGGYFVE